MIPRRGAYGIDAPYWLTAIAGFALVALVFGGIGHSGGLLLAGAALIAATTSFLYTTRRGKFIIWAELLEQLTLRGDERVLDLGCGRGAILMLAAEHLGSGRAVGVDIWRSGDQSGNSAEAAARNAEVEGVSDRVELRTADITALPFEDRSFDLVLSSLAIHNIRREDRAKAIFEAARVLRPAGRLAIADIVATRHYAIELEKLGMQQIESRSLGWRMWWGAPWIPTRLVSAAKPAQSPSVAS